MDGRGGLPLPTQGEKRTAEGKGPLHTSSFDQGTTDLYERTVSAAATNRTGTAYANRAVALNVADR
jgi:hypothetical protein